MRVSRSGSNKHSSRKRRRKTGQLVLLNLTLLLAIAALIAVWVYDDSDNKERTSASNGAAAPGHNAASNLDEGSADPAQNKDDNPGVKSDEDGAITGEEQQGQEGADSNGESELDGNGQAEEPTEEPEKAVEPGTGSAGQVSGKSIKLAFVGDVLLADKVNALMKTHGYGYPYAKASDYLKNPDLTAANLESPITTRGTPAPNKQFVFQGSPAALPALTESGIDVVSLANNHTLDMGVVGLLDTIGHLDEAGMPHVGGGNDESEAYQPVILEAKGVKVAYIGLSRVLPIVEWKATKDRPGVAESYDPTRGLEAIRKAKEKADLVVVMVHWGIERNDYPEKYQQALARQYIDAGADLVIGSHPHVLQGFETYKGKWIAYSLGNFIFNMTKTEKTKDTGVLDAQCTKEGDCKLQFHPMKAIESQPTPLEGNSAKELLARLSKMSLNARVDEQGYIIQK